MDKKTIGIITRHAVPNYGSFLQTYATEVLFQELGYKTFIVDYRREDETTEALIKYYICRKPGVFSYIYYNSLWRFSHFYIHKMFSEARKKYLHCTDLVTKENIEKTIEKFDFLVTGSDQVWNQVGTGITEEIDGNYFWNMAKDGKKIISYAASFGDKMLSNENYGRCANYLKRFDCISVREDTGVDILSEMGYKSCQVLDPTFMIDRGYWINFSNKWKNKKSYVLVYNLHSDSNMYRYIKENVQESGLEIWSITTTYRRTIGKRIFCPTIEEFLGLFANAKCVYTDSFHAIVFSIIYKVPFVATLPKQYSTRLESVLRLFGLENRTSDIFYGKAWDETLINWNMVYDILENEKQKSMQWLKKSLEGSTDNLKDNVSFR